MNLVRACAVGCVFVCHAIILVSGGGFLVPGEMKSK